MGTVYCIYIYIYYIHMCISITIEIPLTLSSEYVPYSFISLISCASIREKKVQPPSPPSHSCWSPTFGCQEYVPSELKSLVDKNPGKKKWALLGGSTKAWMWQRGENRRTKEEIWDQLPSSTASDLIKHAAKLLKWNVCLFTMLGARQGVFLKMETKTGSGSITLKPNSPQASFQPNSDEVAPG